MLKGWRPKTESDECGFGSVIVERLEATQDVLFKVCIEDITECMPTAARVDFDSAGRPQRPLAAERYLCGKDGELKMSERNLAKQRRKYRAGRVIQSLPKST